MDVQVFGSQCCILIVADVGDQGFQKIAAFFFNVSLCGYCLRMFENLKRSQRQRHFLLLYW